MYSLVDKVALVTGGANGIGAGIVREFLKENVKFIAILDIDQPSGIELVREIVSTHGNKRVRFFKCDVTNDEELHNIFDKLIEEFGIIDVVVNNAGIFDETLVTFKKEIAVNYVSIPAHAQPLTECDSTRRDVGSTESPALARNVPTNFSRPPAAAGSDASLHSLKIQTKDTTVLLPTAVVYVYNNAGERFKMRVLLDTENNKVAHPDSSVAAIQTTLGYILMGKASYLTPSHSKEKSFHIFSENTESNLDKLTQRFWELDSVPTKIHRILYRFDSNDPIDTYEFNCVSFGLSASPYLAMRVIKELANDERSRYPAGAWAAGRHFYMDDFVSSVPSLEDATNLYYELVNLFNAGGFKLTKWISNNTRLLQEIPPELRSPNIVQFDEHSITASTKIVGLQWEPNDDVFTFKVNVPTEYKCTKRIILSVTARLFDPLSLLGPVTALLKLLVQECWKQNLHWDEEVSTSISDQWFQLQRELHLLERLQIPRHIGIFQTTNNISLIGFADASEKCYGAVIYLRVSSSESGDGQITLLCSRSRVASPKGNVSLPRLELCANLLLSNLIVAVKDSISERVTINKIYAFSDSTIALSWVRSPAHRFQTFVANRIAAINANLPAENWFHISGKENPADIISRPILPAKFINNTLWFHGPPWATLPFKEWPINECHSHAIDELPEHKTLISLTAKVCTDNESTDLYYNSAMRMSNWNKFIHSWVYVLRFTKTLKSQGNITVADLEIAENYILRAIQKRHCLNINSPALRKLNAFLDSNKIIRVGGRLSQSQLGYSQMHPVVLPSKDRIVHLLVDYFHRQNTHAGPALLLALLRQNYWVIAARNMVRQRVQSCNRCFKLKPKNTFPVMGDLPPYRVSEVKSFVFSGVDFAGPLYITPYRRRGVKSIKAYLCLFVCLTTKALHLELVSDLSTESFLNAFKRFISRKGPISLIRSDSGGAFVKADRCLKEIHELLSKDKFLDQHLADLRIQLQRNPPYAPHFGGIWESNIKSVKTHLFRVIGNQILTYEELNTVLIQIEGIMNSRPLCVLSSDPSDLTALTPSHFLNITPLKYLPAEDLTDVPQNRLTRYQLLSKLVQSYWDRWNREYLTSLQSRQKWNTPSNPIKVGCIVIIRDDNSPPLSWPLAIVEELYPGRDGIVRAARVKTRIGYYTRAVTALVSSTLKALHLMRVDHGGKGGTIINVSSALALTQRAPIPFVYAGTKSAVLQFSNCMGMDDYYKHTNVRVVTICFGATDTNMFNTIKTYDDLIRDAMLHIQNYNQEVNLLQSPNTAARGVVESYKRGKSGSTWLVNSSKIYDISDDIHQAYTIMSKYVAF
ncbi:uncharacterized protein LOC112051333 [Bicyclus anynana]|uniref:Uncharacterized protein LOC112051333 n=1 Tax=Bicyclus anynana TaxID=110368 RepID=A0ABM3LFG4_BICAN|nr:uncharacterized protein LOC112051333 [Bicyclus anynana]